MPVSSKTEAALIRAIAERTHSQIGVLALEIGFDGQAVGANKLERVHALIRAIKAERTPEDAERILIDLAEQQLLSYNDWQFENSDGAQALLRSLELDGFAFQNHTLVPATPGPVALHKEISEIERQLDSAGFETALRHYEQAVDNFVKGNFEAANSQTRSFLEDLFMRLCERERSKSLRNAPAALQHLKNTG